MANCNPDEAPPWRARGLVASALLLAMLLLTPGLMTGSGPAKANDYADCTSFDIPRIMAGCTALIEARQVDGRDLAGLYHNRASARSRSGAHEAARTDYDAAIAISPDWALLYYNRAGVLQSLKDRAGAIRDYEKAIELDPTYQKAFYNLGNLHRRAGENDDAIRYFSAAVELNPKYLQAHHHLARLFRKRGDLASSLTHYDAVVELASGDTEMRAERGSARLDADDPAGALADFDAAGATGSNATVQAGRIIALANLGRGEEAGAAIAVLRAPGRADANRAGIEALQTLLTARGRYTGSTDGVLNPELTRILETCVSAASC